MNNMAAVTATAPSNPATQPDEVPGRFPEPSTIAEDGYETYDFMSLSRAVEARRSEYVRQKNIKVRIGSWNVAALPGLEGDIGNWFVRRPASRGQPANSDTDGGTESGTTRLDGPGLDGVEGVVVDLDNPAKAAAETKHGDVEPCDDEFDIYVLGLQEIVDISSPTEALRPYVDAHPSQKWKDAVQAALPHGYHLVSSQQLIGLLLLVYAAPSVASSISSVSSTSIGTGLMGYMGNKGATATRIVIGGTTRLVFINCHMSAGADKASLERRNWDAAQVTLRAKFDPINDQDDITRKNDQGLGDEEFAFWFGDLNYRLDDIPGEDVRRLLHLHTGNEFRLQRKSHEAVIGEEHTEPGRRSSGGDLNAHQPSGSISMIDNSTDPNLEPDMDPASLYNTLNSLLPHDQLRAQQKKRKALHEGWREGPIEFLPTYKYDIGSTGTFDSSEKQRGPSWCDRILYRSHAGYMDYRNQVQEAEEAKKRDEEMKNLGLEQAAEDDNVLFDYDPDLDGANYDYNEDEAESDTLVDLPNSESQTDETIAITEYTSHQNIVSSDHKPLHADFTLTFDAVVPDLKSKIHQEVVRELDKAENEARPDITLVVDDHSKRRSGTTEEFPEPGVVKFGQVRYDVPVFRSLTLANTGGVPATFSFHYGQPLGQEAGDLSSPWFRLEVDWPADDGTANDEAPEYTLPLGESAHIRIILCIRNLDFVRDLNIGKKKIEDIVVLRVSGGRDHFLSIRGSWLPSSFGFSLEELTRMPEEGVRSLKSANGELSALENDKSPVRLSAPRELFKLTEAVAELTERSVAEWDMICNDDDPSNNSCPWKSKQAGWPFEPETWDFKEGEERGRLLACVREALDTNTPFASHFPPELPWRHRTELLAETLVSFLRSLRDGIITKRLWDQLEEQQEVFRDKSRPSMPLSIEQAQSQILEVLSTSPVHSVSFTFLTFMLTRISNEIAPVMPLETSDPIPPKTPTTPTTPTSPSISSIFPTVAASQIQEPLGPTSPSQSPSRSSLSFPFRFKSRARGVSGTHDTTGAAVAQHNPSLARREAVNKSFLSIFTNLIYSASIGGPEKDRERRIWDEKRRAILEPFLRTTDTMG